MVLRGMSKPAILSTLKIGNLDTLTHHLICLANHGSVPGKNARYSTTDFSSKQNFLKQTNPFPV